MKRPIKYPKKYPKNYQDNQTDSDSNKKTISIEDNKITLLNFFKISSKHKSTSIIPSRQPDKIEKYKNYRLSKYNFGKQKKKKNVNIKKLLKKKKNIDNNKINISNFVFFSEKYCQEIKHIFENNFIRNFNRYLEINFEDDRKNIGPRHDLNISKITFNKFVQQIFQQFITKYLLNTYNDLIYVSKNYMTDINNENNYDEIELLSYNEKQNIFLEYTPINLSESNLFYPELSSIVVKFIKNFRKKLINKEPKCALLLYRPNNDFITYISKIRLICDQMGYNLLVKENEVNKLMTFEKLKLINQNYIIGSLKDKNKKYLEIIEAVSNTDKWKKFVEENELYSLVDEDKKIFNKIDKTQRINNNRYKKISKSQSTIHTTQDLSKKIINKNKGNNILSNTILTFIGHNSEEIKSQNINENNNSKEYNIAQNYQQNILEKFNKRQNLILFVDNFEENEDNIKYINQINSLIPNSRSPIIILTNNLSLFTNNLIIGNKSFQTRYIPYQIINEGVIQKEHVIYITFLIMYFISFFPNFKLKKEIILNNINNKDINNDISINLQNINEHSNADKIKKENENNDYILEFIKKSINNIFTNINLNTYGNTLYSSLITLSYIVSIINNYELDNILVYLKNLFLFNDKESKNNYIKLNPLNIIASLKNKIFQEIEEFQVNEDINNEDLLKLNDKYELYSFSDYEYGVINNIGEKQYKSKIRNYGINKGVDFNKESFFYINEFYDDYKDNQIFNYISNKELNERIIEDYKFFHSYYNSSNTILNHSDIIKINIILTQIIFNERISLDDTSRFLGIKYSKRSNYQNQNKNSNNNLMKEKISLLNKIFKNCPFELFNKYINAHIGLKYYIEVFMDNKKYYIPDKLLFYNYYNDYYLMEQIDSEQKNKFYNNEEDEYEEEDLDEEEEY